MEVWAKAPESPTKQRIAPVSPAEHSELCSLSMRTGLMVQSQAGCDNINQVSHLGNLKSLLGVQAQLLLFTR
jgi:hypothetical protein